MKIGILTLTLHTNYGGILQAYALQTTLQKLGHDVQVLNTQSKKRKVKCFLILKRFVNKLRGKNIVVFSERKYYREAPVINKKVYEFRERYIKERVLKDLLEIRQEDYDCIIVGSDQIWRPIYFKEQWCHPIEDAFLAFTDNWNIKRISYAASFGVDKWECSEQETTNISKLISKFDAVSVREETGIKICKDVFNASAVRVLDPTMLLTSSEYEHLIDIRNIKELENSLSYYILDMTALKQEVVANIAKKKNFNLFNTLIKTQQYSKPIEERTLISVEEWLNAFQSSRLIVTDSFHACVFSIIFHKDFIVIGNKKRGQSRFNNLLSMFGLEDRLVENIEQAYYVADRNIEWDSIDKKLLHYRELSFSFLKESL